jgi:hypothetical protein
MDWEKVSNCKHLRIYPNYAECLGCPCGAYEYHCKDCKVFFNDCYCGEMQGLSGRSLKFHNKIRRKKLEKSIAKK